MLKRKDRQPGALIVRFGAAGLILVLGLSACGPLASEEEEPTATAGAQVQRATESASPASSPVLDEPPASPQSEATTSGDGLDIDATPASGEATPVSDADDLTEDGATPDAGDELEATPELVGDATPQDDETPDTVVDSCSPDAIPPFEGDNPNFVTTVDLNFREGPGEDCDQIGDPLGAGRDVVVLSEPVTREGEDQEWIQVEVDGETGWVAAQFIEPAE